MAFNVTEFRSNMIGDGARPNLFNVTLILPPSVTNSSESSKQLSFMAKAAQLPGSSVGTVPVYYFGRELKFAGNRTFPDWTLQIINDENFSIRNSLENWLNSINSHEGNVRGANSVAPSSYSKHIITLGFDSRILQTNQITEDVLSVLEEVSVPLCQSHKDDVSTVSKKETNSAEGASTRLRHRPNTDIWAP
mgnify:CR=1 FL=1